MADSESKEIAYVMDRMNLSQMILDYVHGPDAVEVAQNVAERILGSDWLAARDAAVFREGWYSSEIWDGTDGTRRNPYGHEPEDD